MASRRSDFRKGSTVYPAKYAATSLNRGWKLSYTYSFKDQSIVRNYNSKFLYRHEGIQLLQTYFVAIFQVKVHTRLIFQILGYGILFRVSEENIAAHRNDRKIRIFDESNIIKVGLLNLKLWTDHFLGKRMVSNKTWKLNIMFEVKEESVAFYW